MVNVRSSNKVADKFDDLSILTFDRKPIFFAVSTCDAGYDNLVNPVNDDGCAIVMNGYYPDMWSEGLHKGKYKALVQTGNVAVFRDANKDAVLDYPDVHIDDDILAALKAGTETFNINGKDYIIQYGLFGINFHRASSWQALTEVGLYSAGCCVVQDPKRYDNMIMAVSDILSDSNLKAVDALYTSEDQFNYIKA